MGSKISKNTIVKKKPLSGKILFPLGERELKSSGERILRLTDRLTDYGYHVDILTYHDDVVNKAQELFEKNPKIAVVSTKQEERLWTMIQRDSFAKSFIKLTHDIVVPGTDLKFWKQVGFDDFLWNVSSVVFPKITGKYDLVLFPIPSWSETPTPLNDVFCTNVIFYARDNNVPVAGLQVHPVYEIAPLFPRLMDFFIVKEPYEKDYFSSIGVKRENIFVIEDFKDNYCIDTVEDVYKNLAFDEQISVGREKLGIVLINHAQNRSQLYDIFSVVSELDIEKELFICMREYAVKELHEKDIFDDLIKPKLTKAVKKFYSVDAGGAIKALMLSDVIIGTSYTIQLSFAGRYNKKGIVYNPLQEGFPNIEGVVFTSSREQLKEEILKQFRKKQQIITIGDIVNRILHDTEE